MAKSADHTPPPDPGIQATGRIEAAVLRTRKAQMFSTSVAVIARAREELEDLSGYKVDSVSGFEKTEEGWRLTMTVVELRRIPAATDVLGSYEVILNGTGDIITYHRGNRYFRDQVGQEE
jgi:hypothetical protein